MTCDDEVMREFLLESGENLEKLDKDFVTLEREPSSRDLLGGIFRCIHTIKGTSGFLSLSKLEALTHTGESLLSRARDGALVLDTSMINALLTMVDGVRRILASVEATGGEPDEDFSPIVAELNRVMTSKPVGAAPAAVAVVEAPPAVIVVPARDAAPPPVVVAAAPPPAPELTEVAEAKAGTSIADTTIRVDVVLLDRVMNLVGELVLARNQIIQFGATAKDASFLKASQRLNLLTTELQEGVMKTRMQPIGNVWGKFPRIVRDLSQALGKRVELQLVGEGTELDRTIIEAIKDPLTHAVRNAVDHGIERPEKRLANGKPEAGTLLLRAYHEGGQVNIEISDDGAGLDLNRIRSRAVERELITAERAARMGERELSQLIFQPGFSTAETVTNVSGRGVGMDVVKTNIEKIGGTVDISSTFGKGSTIKIKIPLTLAIIPALIVTSQTERFAIPQVNLLELVRLEGPQARAGIERIHGTTVYRLRGNLLPLVYLDKALEIGNRTEEPEVVNIVVLQANDRQFGIVVDGINDTEEIVVKPLGKELKGISTFAGATIMGDGKVALILDVLGLAQRTAVVSEARERGAGDKGGSPKGEGEPKETLLLFRVGPSGRMAIPLSMVSRLEELSRSSVEIAAGHEVVQYRGAILPLVDLGRVLGLGSDGDASSPLQVVVYSEQGRSVGFVVDQILDIVEETITVRHRGGRGGVTGSVVVQGKVTDMLDVRSVIHGAVPSFFEDAA